MPEQTPRPKSIRTLTDLTPDPGNANRGTPRGRTLLAHSLRELGAGRSILIDRDGHVLAGNKTVEQAKTLDLPIELVQTTGERLVVVQRVDLQLTEDSRARRLALADNRVAEVDLDWDVEQLKADLAADIDLSEWWTAGELERLFAEGLHPGHGDENAVITPSPTTIRVGDRFALGPHRVVCGDATDPATVTRLLGGETPAIMVTDPPYGVNYDPGWRATLPHNRGTAMGRVANDDRNDWEAAYRLFPGDVAYVWHAGLHAGPVATSLAAAGFDLRAQIVWVKPHFALSRGDYHWQHEPCWYAVRRGGRSGWTGDRTQSTTWEVPSLNPFGGGDRTGDNAVTGHSTQKPVRLFERPLLHHTQPGASLYDPFVGSGTAIIAAQKTGRRAFAIDLDPVYIHAAITRWERFTGQRAIRLEGDGE